MFIECYPWRTGYAHFFANTRHYQSYTIPMTSTLFRFAFATPMIRVAVFLITLHESVISHDLSLGGSPPEIREATLTLPQTNIQMCLAQTNAVCFSLLLLLLLLFYVF